VVGNATIDEDQGRAGDLGYLQDEVPGEIFPKQREA